MEKRVTVYRARFGQENTKYVAIAHREKETETQRFQRAVDAFNGPYNPRVYGELISVMRDYTYEVLE